MSKTLKFILLLLLSVMVASCGHDEIQQVPRPNNPWSVHLAGTTWTHSSQTVVNEGGVDIGYTFRHRLEFYDDSTGHCLRRVWVDIAGEPTDSIAEPMPFGYTFTGLTCGVFFVHTRTLDTEVDTTFPFIFDYDEGILVVDNDLVFIRQS